jgi:hypothetical protein
VRRMRKPRFVAMTCLPVGVGRKRRRLERCWLGRTSRFPRALPGDTIPSEA